MRLKAQSSAMTEDYVCFFRFNVSLVNALSREAAAPQSGGEPIPRLLE